MKKSDKVNSTLRDLDSFPDSAHVRIPVVKALLGVSNATIWRMVAEGKINRYKLTKHTATFNLGELRAFINQKVKG